MTQKQWCAVAKLPQVNCDLNSDPSSFKGDNRPVESVIWDEAVEFCDRLSQYTGRQYRLPSEAEWEYACRAGTYTSFYFGSTLTPNLARCKANFGGTLLSIVRVGDKTSEVGKFFPNSFGLYDMHGNVYEWCEDDWHDNYNGAPQDGTAWLSRVGIKKVVRGGSWDFLPNFCRCAYRLYSTRDYRYFNIGFRVVCVASWTT